MNGQRGLSSWTARSKYQLKLRRWSWWASSSCSISQESTPTRSWGCSRQYRSCSARLKRLARRRSNGNYSRKIVKSISNTCRSRNRIYISPTKPSNSKSCNSRVIDSTTKSPSRNTKGPSQNSSKKYTPYVSSYYNIANKYRPSEA